MLLDAASAAGGGGAGGADHAAGGGALAHAYRANALAEPAYYGVMFQQAIPRFRPSAGSLAAGRGQPGGARPSRGGGHVNNPRGNYT